MITIKRIDSSSNDFQSLVKCLDLELNSRYGALQSQYIDYNRIEALDTVVIVYIDEVPAGCGCFKAFHETSVEIKRMFVRPEYRGKGLAGMILSELEQWAAEKGYSMSVLETGIGQPEAIRLYSKNGYVRTSNYGQYAGNPNSCCMSKRLL
jgi:GNAT superfamily N-acetyltransferase